ncbi:MAG: hypothetical protein HY617_03825 [Candidatus Sungbacteria bacterium]|nr:hypothetical protein [Candidatus Sungbacteria bacterium]
MNQEIKQCQNCKKPFTIKPEDFEFYEKIKVPPPTWCPECRFQRRMIWRNENIFYKRKCDATGKDIFSMFSPNAPVKVYDRDYWWSDQWDPMQYGNEYDFSRPFFEQLKELIQTVPWPSRSFLNNVRSEYCMNCSNLKECYMLFDADFTENSSYGVALNQARNCFDILSVDFCELCYECFDCVKCYGVLYSSNCEDCNNVVFCKDCINCTDCFGCVGLRNKSHCIFNMQYSPEEYSKKIAEFDLGSHQSLLEVKKKAREAFQMFPVRFMHGSHNQNVSGDYVYHSRNVLDSYMVADGEDSRFCSFIKLPFGPKNCYDYDLFGWNAEKIYECNNVGYNASNIKFSVLVYIDSYDVEYSFSCSPSVNNLFGCVGLRNKSYCILNKQYSKEEYEKLLIKIKEHMNAMPYRDARGREYAYGEFIPAELCPYAYNESVVQEYMPLSQVEAVKRGFLWRDPAVKDYLTTMSWQGLPDHINDVPDSLLKETILCENWDNNQKEAQQHNCTKAFRITASELEFYRNMKLSLPRKCFYCRHRERTLQRSPVLKKWQRQCACDNQVYKNSSEHAHHMGERCPNNFQTSYAPDRPEIVYCETCYQTEIV